MTGQADHLQTVAEIVRALDARRLGLLSDFPIGAAELAQPMKRYGRVDVAGALLTVDPCDVHIA